MNFQTHKNGGQTDWVSVSISRWKHWSESVTAEAQRKLEATQSEVYHFCGK